MAQHDSLRQPGGRVPVALVAAGTTALLIGLVSQQLTHGQEVAGWALGMTAAALLLVGATLTQLARTTLRVRGLWPVVAVLTALTGEAVLGTARLAMEREGPPGTANALTTGAAALGAVLTLVALFAVLTGRRPSPVAWGGAVGLLLAAAASPTGHHELWTATALLLVHGVLAAAVVRAWPWSTSTRAALATAVVALGAAGALADVPVTGLLPTAAAAAELVAGGVAGLIAATVAWRDLVARTLAATAPSDPGFAEEASRDRVERHAMRNMAAGISMASELLEEDDLEEPVRRRLEHTIHEEAEQLCRLLDRNGSSAGPTAHERFPAVPCDGAPPASNGVRQLQHQTGEISVDR